MKSTNKDNTVEIDIEILQNTALAVLAFDGDRYIWIPKSQILEPREDNYLGSITITIPEWLAIEKELI